jgi:hypothetical protein
MANGDNSDNGDNFMSPWRRRQERPAQETIKRGGFAVGPMRAPVDLGAGPDALDDMEESYSAGLQRMLRKPGRGRRHITDKTSKN